MVIDLVQMVAGADQLPKHTGLDFVSATSKKKVHILSVERPFGPIHYLISDEKHPKAAPKKGKITTDRLRIVAGLIVPYRAFNIDALLNGGGNNRAVIEVILAYQSEFYVCRPSMCIDGVMQKNKRLYMDPDRPHRSGILVETDSVRGLLSDESSPRVLPVPSRETPTHTARNFHKLRRHEQMQVLLFEIGAALGYRNWIASNDQTLKLNGKPLVNDMAAIRNLATVNILQPFPAAQKAARLIDMIYFKDDGYIPAVFEIESTTTVMSGLMRMEAFRLSLHGVFRNRGSLGTCFVIVADEARRAEVVRKANAEQFSPLTARFMSFDEVEELWRFCKSGRAFSLNDRAIEAFSSDCRKIV